MRTAGLSRMRRLGLALLVATGVAGCATAAPVDSGRMGLLDRISQADHSRQSNRFAGITRAPASRQAILKEDKQSAQRRAAIEISVGQLHWPLNKVEITSTFGKRGREFHEGLDLRAKPGTTVFAAQEGTVIYAGNKIRGYGSMVVIRHYREISTIYAHNSRLLVRTGQFVHQGQQIAISGNTGHSHGPHLHFEVRDGLAALNPLDLLRSSRPTSAGQNIVPPTAPLPKASMGKPVARTPVPGIRRSGARIARSAIVASAKDPARSSTSD